MVARSGAALLVLCGVCGGQSLLDRRPVAPEANSAGVVTPVATDGTMSLLEASVTAIEPPDPVTYEENDLVTIIISERSTIAREATVETDKTYAAGGTVNNLPDPLKLLQLRYEDYDRLPQTLDASGSLAFDGEGTYERDDTVVARVTARVIEVKPNGTLLLESKTSVVTDGEEQVIVVSGLCRQEDITFTNTVQSNQMANLVIRFDHSGDVKDGSKKGIIPKVIETIFNF